MKDGIIYLKAGTGKNGKGNFILSVVIVITLAVLASLALACSRGVERESRLLALLRSAGSARGILKILVCLLAAGVVTCLQIRYENTLMILAEIVYTLAVTFSLGRWGIYMACVERGYQAVGGEYSFLFMACWVSWVSIAHFFESLEGLREGRALAG